MPAEFVSCYYCAVKHETVLYSSQRGLNWELASIIFNHHAHLLWVTYELFSRSISYEFSCISSIHFLHLLCPHFGSQGSTGTYPSHQGASSFTIVVLLVYVAKAVSLQLFLSTIELLACFTTHYEWIVNRVLSNVVQVHISSSSFMNQLFLKSHCVVVITLSVVTGKLPVKSPKSKQTKYKNK